MRPLDSYKISKSELDDIQRQLEETNYTVHLFPTEELYYSPKILKIFKNAEILCFDHICHNALQAFVSPLCAFARLLCSFCD